jgi:diguanylate cyclase (GGDEF)-like protein
MVEDALGLNSRIVDIAQTFSEEDNHDNLLEMIVAEALIFAGADAASIYIKTDIETLRFECLAIKSLGIMRGGASGEPLGIPDVPLSSKIEGRELHFEVVAAYHECETRLVEENMSERQEYYTGASFFGGMLDYEVVTALSIPLSIGKPETLGVLQVFNPLNAASEPVAFAKEMIPWIESLASLAAMAIHNRRLVDSHVAKQEKLAKLVQQKTAELESIINDLKAINARLLEEKQVDHLTGVNNRKAFEEAFSVEWRRAERYKFPLSLLMIDIDHFKSVNDTYGHLAGDECLRIVSDLIQTSFNRSADLVARYGGEEFVVLLPYLHTENAVLCAERARAMVEAKVFVYADIEIRLTASVGVSTLVPEQGMDPTELIKLADEALYRAKDAGRNCIRQMAVP